MILKSYIVEQNFNDIVKYKSVLFYGENNGIKDDLKEKIIETNKNAEIINLFQDEIIKNNNVLYNIINNSSLFASEKIIFLHEISDKIFNQINECIELLTKEIKIYIFSNNLDRKSKLRSFFEKDNGCGIIPCYQDSEKTLLNYITSKLKKYKGLTPEIVNIILNNSNLDRKIVKDEIIKIKNFFYEKTIKKEELQELLNIKINNNFEQIRDAALIGDKIGVNRLIGEIEFTPEEIFFYLNQINSRVSKLLEIKNINMNIKNEELAMDSMKPKIFWKDKPVFKQQLKKWNKSGLEKASKKIGKTELLMKTNSYLRNDLLVKDLLIKICGQASSFA